MMNQDVHDGRWHSALGTPKTVRWRAVVPWVIAGLAVVAGAALAGATTAAAAPVTVGAGAAPTLYVPSVNSGSVTPINTATNVKGKPIRTGRFSSRSRQRAPRRERLPLRRRRPPPPIPPPFGPP